MLNVLQLFSLIGLMKWSCRVCSPPLCSCACCCHECKLELHSNYCGIPSSFDLGKYSFSLATNDRHQIRSCLCDAGGSALKGKCVVVVGAGGAGRALAFGAVERGAKVLVCNR